MYISRVSSSPSITSVWAAVDMDWYLGTHPALRRLATSSFSPFEFLYIYIYTYIDRYIYIYTYIHTYIHRYIDT